jgi:hypothetical protein
MIQMSDTELRELAEEVNVQLISRGGVGKATPRRYQLSVNDSLIAIDMNRGDTLFFLRGMVSQKRRS